MLYALFRVIPQCLNLICQRFGTLFVFHLLRWVSMKNDWGWECWCICTGKGSLWHVPYPLHICTVGLHSLFLYLDPPLPCRPPSDWLRLSLRQTFSRLNTPTSQHRSFFITTGLWRWDRQSVPKCWHIKFRCQGITQKKAYNIQNTAKVWNQEKIMLFGNVVTLEDWNLQ